jgi:hypothetical protein
MFLDFTSYAPRPRTVQAAFVNNTAGLARVHFAFQS